MTIDSLVFLGSSRFGVELTAEALATGCREQDVSLSLASPPHPPDHDLRAANERILSAVDRSGGALLGLFRVDPWDAVESIETVERAAALPGIRGLLLHPAEEHFRINDPRVRPVADRAAALGLPVVVATGTPWQSEATQVAEFARWCGDAPVVMTNGGQYNISGLSQTDAEAALTLENVHLHTNGVYREDFLQRVVGEFGQDRLLFASGAPSFDVRYEKRRVELLHVDDGARDAVLAGNARRLFAIPDAEVPA